GDPSRVVFAGWPRAPVLLLWSGRGTWNLDAADRRGERFAAAARGRAPVPPGLSLRALAPLRLRRNRDVRRGFRRAGPGARPQGADLRGRRPAPTLVEGRARGLLPEGRQFLLGAGFRRAGALRRRAEAPLRKGRSGGL